MSSPAPVIGMLDIEHFVREVASDSSKRKTAITVTIDVIQEPALDEALNNVPLSPAVTAPLPEVEASATKAKNASRISHFDYPTERLGGRCSFDSN
jgi:hypothetical protein